MSQTQPDYNRTRRACHFSYLAMSSVFSLPPMLFAAFHSMYGISYTLLGTLILINFCTQLSIDLIFTFFSRFFNIRMVVRIMPLLTSTGLCLYALIPWFLPEHAFAGLALGTVIFSVAAGLSEVLLSPVITALPSEHPDKDMSLLHSLYGWGVVSVVVISSVYFRIFGTENWMYLTLFWAALPIIASVLFWISPIPDMNLSSGEQKKSGSRAGGLALCVLCIFLGSSAENVMTGWISSFMENALRVPKAAGDILGMAVFALLLAMTRGLYAKYGKNIHRALLISMIGAVVCYVTAGLASNVILAFIACILTGCCTSMLWPGTLILMEEKIPSPGVAAYALMAAGGDFGASVAPQILGALVDRVAVSDFAVELSSSGSMTPEQIGLKAGMLTAAVYPILGALLLVYIGHYFKKQEKV